MSSIGHIPFAGTFNNHLNLTNTTGILSEVIPGQRGSRNFELLGADLGVPYSLPQHTARGVESINKGLPIHKVVRFAASLQAC